MVSNAVAVSARSWQSCGRAERGGHLRSDRHQALDLIRGLAAVGVAIYHWLQWGMHITVQSLGLFSVYLFFILSAVTMCLIYEPLFGDGITGEGVRSFFRNRAARLLPLLALLATAYLLLALYMGGAASTELSKAVLTGTGAMALTAPGFVSNTYGAWSLGTELAFYVAVPIAILLAARTSAAKIGLLFLASIFAQQIYLQLIAPLRGTAHWALYTAFLTFAPFFCLGFLIFKADGRRSVGSLWPMLICYLSVACFSLLWPTDLFRSTMPYLLLTALCGGAIFFAYRSDVPAWLGGISVFLGEISYALYLTHPFTNMAVSKVAQAMGLPAPWTLPFYLLAAGAVAYLSYRFFERPSRDYFRGERRLQPATLP